LPNTFFMMDKLHQSDEKLLECSVLLYFFNLLL
jgi:hypothetical protein